jgi:hypothetical protein
MKTELKWIALVLYWLALLGFVAPALVSAASNEAVFAGVGLLGVSAYLTSRYVRRNQEGKRNENG